MAEFAEEMTLDLLHIASALDTKVRSLQGENIQVKTADFEIFLKKKKNVCQNRA